MAKPCIKCKYFSQNISDARMMCIHPESLIGSDPVTGAVAYFSCTEMRNQYKCGAEGTFFVEVKRNMFLTLLKNWFLR